MFADVRWVGFHPPESKVLSLVSMVPGALGVEYQVLLSSRLPALPTTNKLSQKKLVGDLVVTFLFDQCFDKEDFSIEFFKSK